MKISVLKKVISNVVLFTLMWSVCYPVSPAKAEGTLGGKEFSVESAYPITEDAYVHQNFSTNNAVNYQDTNYGSAEQLEVVDISNANGAGDRMAYLKADFSKLSSSPINSAKLFIYVREAVAAQVSLKVELVKNDWSENTISWNNRGTAAVVSEIGKITVSSAGWYSIDVSDQVRASLNNKVISFRISDPATKASLVKINSRESIDSKPYLAIDAEKADVSNNANLSALSLKSGSSSIAISPKFNKDILHYTSTVTILGLTGTSVNVAPVSEDTKASIKVNGKVVASGSDSEAIGLNIGDNVINVAVTAEDGTYKQYTINITGNGVTIDSHFDGQKIETGKVRISGTYKNTYGIKVNINGESIYDAVMQATSGESGNWYYDLDSTKYDGKVEVFIRGNDSVTRYGLAAPLLYLNVDNPQANVPTVIISDPADGSNAGGIVPVKVSVVSKNPLQSVQVRMNGGQWQNAASDGKDYVYTWDTTGIGNKTCSIEAKATDSYGHSNKTVTNYVHVGTGSKETIRVDKQDRAMWIWESASYNLLYNPGSRELLDAFCKDTGTFSSNAITTLYLGVERYRGEDIVTQNPALVREFVSWAHNRGYKVFALIEADSGIAQMGAYERYHANAVRAMEKIINYNISSKENEGFDGVNVDVEPYTLPDFGPATPSLQLQYLDMLDKMIQRRNAAESRLVFGPAIAKWFDTAAHCLQITWKGQTKPLSEHVQDICDYVSIMDYRDSAGVRGVSGAGIIPQAENEINYANKIGKANSVVLGVETLDIANSGDPESITFREEGRAYMEEQLKLVYDAFKDDPSFGGVAVHHYDSIRELPSSWKQDGTLWQPPMDNEAPTGVSEAPKAAAVDFQTISISYGRAADNYEVEYYKIYRSTTSGFTPDSSSLAGVSRGLAFRDTGLLPNTTYYYKVAAVDSYGNIGPASMETSAATGSTNLKPMVISSMEVKPDTGGKAKVSLTVADYRTGEGIQASVYGRFTNADGIYRSFEVSPEGGASNEAETLSKKSGLEGWQIGFEPRRILADGYYWAQAYDKTHVAYLYSKNVNLKGLISSDGALVPAFNDEIQRYRVAVPASVTSITVTPSLQDKNGSVTVNGIPLGSNSPSQRVDLNTGSNVITIIVTAQDGMTKKRYTITAEVIPDIETMQKLVKNYTKSGELKESLSAQLYNSLETARHMVDKNSYDKASKHLEDFIKHLNSKAMDKFISEGARRSLNCSAELLYGKWKNMNQ